MELAFEEQGVMNYASGKETLTPGVNDKENNAGQVKVKQLIMASLSMALGQRVMMKRTGTDMWKYLVYTYEGKTNAATRVNQEIILFNWLQTMKCKLGDNVAQHVDKAFMMKDQLAALNADVRDPIADPVAADQRAVRQIARHGGERGGRGGHSGEGQGPDPADAQLQRARQDVASVRGRQKAARHVGTRCRFGASD
ncbi:hypothetical protein PHYSODRAFT_293384 [Phytophthora sojae]|uniref:Uncharacterized protein n=1 Tax=Phytophthora sojae (strain P6497) TaxID=1094619 RepID=G4YM19_PHYSP|nr:hypothetical protein PHYSODRAFT_293384 [Phytophthora sojae]EGZ27549.1 hypothetical protein PHYSODRAFT_293384 [Phytophthora sojae]|eukprot:XP_009514824.1 hypothetical protein PHYSODRAFT_293384 [Phytophthora sojae]